MLTPRSGISSLFFLNGFLLAQWISRIPALAGALELSSAQLGVALFGIAVGSLASFPFSGFLITRTGSHRTTVGFALFFAVTLPLLALAPNLSLLFLALMLFGAGVGGMDVAMNAQGVEVEKRAGKAILNSLHGFFSLGGFLGAGVGGLLASLEVTPLLHFTLVAGAALLVTLFVSRSLVADEEVTAAAPAFALPPRALWGLGAVAFCAAVGEGAMADWSAVYLEHLGTSSGVAALGYAAFSLAMLIARFSGDALVTRLGSKMMVRLGGAVASLGLCAGLVFNTVWAVIVGFGAVGLGLSVVAPLVFGLAGNHPTIPRGQAVAAVATMGYSGFLAGPPVLGFIAEGSSLRVALFVIALLSAAIVILSPVAVQQKTLSGD